MSHQENKENSGNKTEGKEPIKVMLADDDKDDQHLFEEALDRTDVPTELTTADNGQELMDNLHDTSTPNPDIIFLDINMPVKNGKECLEEIKADDELKDIPCVVYSTSNSEKDINDTYKTGANLYVTKPTSFTNIVTILKHIFTLRWHKIFTRPEKKDFVVSERTVRD
ncbi:MAG: response regulator [Bacteroidota bacterium]